MKNKQAVKAFQSQLALINECKQHLARHETHFALSMANRGTYNQRETASMSVFEPVITLKEIMRKEETRKALEPVP